MSVPIRAIPGESYVETLGRKLEATEAELRRVRMLALRTHAHTALLCRLLAARPVIPPIRSAAAPPAQIPRRLHILPPPPAPTRLACGLTFEPALRRFVGRGVVMPLTRSETEVMTAYVLAADRLCNKDQIAAIVGMTRQGTSVHSSRIYNKLREIGIDPSEVWENYVGRAGSGRGMRLLLAAGARGAEGEQAS